MIFVRMGGRLGNQMFLYAFARAIQIARKQDEKIVLLWGESQYDGKDGREDSLKYFNCIKIYKSIIVEYYNIKCLLKYANLMQKFFIICYCSLKKIGFYGLTDNQIFQKIMNKYGIFFFFGDYKSFEIPDSCKNILTLGFKLSEKYYFAIREILLKDFTPIQQELSENFDLYQKICSTNSVCVNIRRGDYLLQKNIAFNVCSKPYFLKAMHIIKEKIPDANFFIFSDDIEWCKANIKFNAPLFFEIGNDPVWETLRLMYSCKHFILSNSTFSWWGQYLSVNENKIVIAPKRWFISDNIKHELNNPSWILIDALALKENSIESQKDVV